MLESVELEYHDKFNNQVRTVDFEISECKSLTNGGSNYLVIEEEMQVELQKGHKTCRCLEIHKVLFIGSYSIVSRDLAKTADATIATFSDNNGDLIGHVIGGNNLLPELAASQTGTLLDYHGYKESCSFTGETALPFLEYYQTKRDCIYGPSTVIFKDGKTFNFQEQDMMYEESKNEKN